MSSCFLLDMNMNPAELIALRIGTN